MDNIHLPHPERADPKHPNYVLRRMVAGLALGSTIAIGGKFGLDTVRDFMDKFDQQVVDTRHTTLQNGGGGIQEVCQAVDILAKKHGISPEEVSNCIRAGQEVNQQLRHNRSTGVLQPGDQLEVTLLKDGFERYFVEADPLNQ